MPIDGLSNFHSSARSQLLSSLSAIFVALMPLYVTVVTTLLDPPEAIVNISVFADVTV